MLQASSLFFSVSFTFLFPHLISSDTSKKDYPETKGVPLEEMDSVFGEGMPMDLLP